MADVVVTIKIMPDDPEKDLGAIETQAKEKITAFAGEGDMKVEHVPIFANLKSLNITFVMDEDKGSTESLEQDLAALEDVQSAEAIDVRRAMG